MSMLNLHSRGLGLLAVLTVAGSAGACNTVSPEELDAGLASALAEARREAQQGNADLEARLNGRIDEVERSVASLEADLQQMERDFEVSIARMEDQLRFNVPVYFGFDDATVEADDQAVLDRFGSIAQEYYPGAMITVEGFTDAAGDEAYNLWLGEQRANAVAEYLVGSTALNEDDVRAVSYGEDARRLLAEGTGPGAPGWENRRVVLVIDHNGQAPAPMSGPQGG